jgi:hypothetical protein
MGVTEFSGHGPTPRPPPPPSGQHQSHRCHSIDVRLILSAIWEQAWVQFPARCQRQSKIDQLSARRVLVKVATRTVVGG